MAEQSSRNTILYCSSGDVALSRLSTCYQQELEVVAYILECTYLIALFNLLYFIGRAEHKLKRILRSISYVFRASRFFQIPA
jgi:hypothetical protein